MDEPNETYTVDLFNETNVIVTDASGLGTIVDDDGAPSLTVNDTSATE